MKQRRLQESQKKPKETFRSGNLKEAYVVLKDLEKPPVLYAVKKYFAEVVAYDTYPLNDKNKNYGDKLVRRISKIDDGIRVQMRQSIFNPARLISILIVFATFKAACDSKKISRGAAIWLVHLCVKNSVITIILGSS